MKSHLEFAGKVLVAMIIINLTIGLLSSFVPSLSSITDLITDPASLFRSKS